MNKSKENKCNHITGVEGYDYDFFTKSGVDEDFQEGPDSFNYCPKCGSKLNE